MLPNSQGGGVLNEIRTVTVFPYTLTYADNQEILLLDSSVDAVLNVPAGLPPRFMVSAIQVGAGKITVTAVGSSVSNVEGLYQTAGVDAYLGLVSKGTDSYTLVGKLI